MDTDQAHDVIARVRRALGRTAPLTEPPVPPEVLEPVAGLVHSEIGLAELLAKRAADNKVHVDTVVAGEVGERVAEYLAGNGLVRIAMPVSPWLERLGVAAALRGAGLEVRTWDRMTLDELYDL